MSDLRFSVPLMETKAVEPAGLLEGLASTFGPPADLAGDIIVKGCFEQSLKDHAEQGSNVAMLFSHAQDKPVGKWLKIFEDDVGLRVSGQLARGVSAAEESLKLASMGCLALSIGFRPIRQKALEDGNYIEQAELAEISLVAIPANRRAQLSVKSLGSVSEYQSFLRAQGLSVRESKRLARSGWSAFRGEEVDEEEIASFIQASAFRLKGI